LKNREIFLRGLLAGVPICLGYLSVSFAFGIFAAEQGLSLGEALLISMTCVTSAGQLAAVPIMAAGGSLVALALSQLVINMRYALMSISLTQKFGPDVRFLDRFWIAFCNTDEIFAVATGEKGEVSRFFMLGLILTPWLGWTGGTLLGALAGNILPAVVTSALGVAIYGMFIAIVMPEMKKERSVAGCVAIAVALSCLIYYVPGLKALSGFSVIICAVIASAVMAWLAPVKEDA
jgi:4-azaleucine resistance transporter AzlC